MPTCDAEKTSETGWLGRILQRLRGALSNPMIGSSAFLEQQSHGFVHRGVAEVSVRAMGHRVGVDPEILEFNQVLHEDLVRNCTKCKQRVECRAWLADFDAEPDRYRDFCVNAERFRTLESAS